MAFTLPYMLNALRSKVGFVYGSMSTLGVIFGYFFVPDLRGRSLEDVNRLFESDHPARIFHKVKLDPVLDTDKSDQDGHVTMVENQPDNKV